MARKKTNDDCGFILLNKAVGNTTFRALRPIKSTFNSSRVGHAGTLDAAASGLVIVGVGQATRLLHYLEAQSKLYTFEIHLGHETDTCEAAGNIVATGKRESASQSEMLEILDKYRGEIEQEPPVYSAIKIDGKRASDRALAGQDVIMKKRPVSIYSLELLEEKVPGKVFSFRCHCSKGTYIRSLARDIGRDLETCALADKIHREAIGDNSLTDAIATDKEIDLKKHLIAPEKILKEIAVIELSDRLINLLKNGVILRADQYKIPENYQKQFVFIKSCNSDEVEIYAEIAKENRLMPRIRLKPNE